MANYVVNIFVVVETNQTNSKTIGHIFADMLRSERCKSWSPKWEKPSSNPNNEKVWKREAHKQKLAETEDELLEKAKKIHPEETFPAVDELSNETSLFRNPDRKNANL